MLSRVNDRSYVFWALIAVVLSMAALVLIRGCGSGDSVIITLGAVATTLAGTLGGISHSSSSAGKVITSTNPQETSSTIETK